MLSSPAPRQSKSRWGNLFLNFSPAVSAKAAKTIRHAIRSWKIHRWTQLPIEELAARFNPVLRGWINYYGSYYRSLLAPILGQTTRLCVGPMGAAEIQTPEG
ncbi:group II intron maturase-specific domain-containing protein [Paraburkholderia aspalathi]|uniref:group II intron maturase-specific domain-containing protein n=1 Tax=Paraburkholderia aspalathi TaxID=1324617 RepID=UPI00398ABB3B